MTEQTRTKIKKLHFCFLFFFVFVWSQLLNPPPVYLRFSENSALRFRKKTGNLEQQFTLNHWSKKFENFTVFCNYDLQHTVFFSSKSVRYRDKKP
jgi:hypothetical protein